MKSVKDHLVSMQQQQAAQIVETRKLLAAIAAGLGFSVGANAAAALAGGTFAGTGPPAPGAAAPAAAAGATEAAAAGSAAAGAGAAVPAGNLFAQVFDGLSPVRIDLRSNQQQQDDAVKARHRLDMINSLQRNSLLDHKLELGVDGQRLVLTSKFPTPSRVAARLELARGGASTWAAGRSGDPLSPGAGAQTDGAARAADLEPRTLEGELREQASPSGAPQPPPLARMQPHGHGWFNYGSNVPMQYSASAYQRPPGLDVDALSALTAFVASAMPSAARPTVQVGAVRGNGPSTSTQRRDTAAGVLRCHVFEPLGSFNSVTELHRHVVDVQSC